MSMDDIQGNECLFANVCQKLMRKNYWAFQRHVIQLREENNNGANRKCWSNPDLVQRVRDLTINTVRDKSVHVHTCGYEKQN